MLPRLARIVPVPLVLVSVGALGSVAGAVGPTDIVRVDDYIGAPRALFGRTGADAERALGPPLRTDAGAVSSYRDPAVFRATRRLSYPGLVIDVLEKIGRASCRARVWI